MCLTHGRQDHTQCLSGMGPTHSTTKGMSTMYPTLRELREAMIRHHRETGHTDCKFLRKLARQELRAAK